MGGPRNGGNSRTYQSFRMGKGRDACVSKKDFDQNRQCSSREWKLPINSMAWQELPSDKKQRVAERALSAGRWKCFVQLRRDNYHFDATQLKTWRFGGYDERLKSGWWKKEGSGVPDRPFTPTAYAASWGTPYYTAKMRWANYVACVTGDIKLVRHLITIELLWRDPLCCALAASRDSLEILSCLREHGCPWNADTINFAAEKTKRITLGEDGKSIETTYSRCKEWALANGCPTEYTQEDLALGWLD